MDAFAKVASVQFYAGMVAYQIDSAVGVQPELIWNKTTGQDATDFRYQGSSSAEIEATTLSTEELAKGSE